ncbi:DUF4294 domain-containing protein [Faecalibacter rhinopitheci]|uniref:DUF4294 domain-containing protein n=1 Tax=Faecalibacter rhinopitheci TaxID=2779678 RepID=A0A8J7FND2_9FLAO|nr:DUF4294 domain-containing protein [Faecalibacter rhinopitheci]MBF0596234.1 DUF4294 domain-containing protein [Faecalibacter rhinopitheci]
MKFYINILFLLLFFNITHAQIFGLDLGVSKKNETESDSIIQQDLTPIDTIYLQDYNHYTIQLKTDLDKKYYFWLRRRVRDVWPYVRTAVREYNSVRDTVSTMAKKRDQRKFIKQRQRDLGDKFEKDLKNMTVSRGQIMTKLIHKETNKTTFEIIKELRGGISAFLYNTAGGIYDIRLKQTFDPNRTREDLYILVILQRDIAAGVLQPIYDDTE